MRRVERRARLLALAAALAVVPVLHAQWQEAPPELRALLEQRAALWESWTPATRALYRQRLDEWEGQPHAVRGARRERYDAWQALDAIDRAQLRSVRNIYAATPPAQQQAWRERFAQLDASVQRGWLLGPRLGIDYAALRPLLQQVPAEQREPLLALLRSMTATERADLAILAQRTPPQERDALRRALLTTTADNRTVWLRLRLER